MLRWDFGLMFKHIRYTLGGTMVFCASVVAAYVVMVNN
jgi:hypothetical protein